MSSSKIISRLVLLFSINSCLVRSAKILAVYPSPAISHQIVFRTLTNELIRRGHEVTVITPDPEFPKGEAPSNLIEIDVHDLSYNTWSECLLKVITGTESDNRSQAIFFMKALSKIFEAQIATKEVQEIISKKQDHYDLLLLEACLKPATALTYVFKAPAIQVSSFSGLSYNYEVVGAPVHPLLYPTPIQYRVYNLSKYEKLQQLYHQWRLESSFYEIEEEDNKRLQKMFGQDIPSIRELSNNIDMLFLNIHPIWTANQPVPPNVVHIGGLQTNSPKELPNDLGLLLNASRNGFIYFSLGTNVNTTVLPQEKFQAMIKVFSQLPYDVIWKCNQDSMPGKTENIKLVKWVPQADLLKHPKIKLFITQGGLQSTDEAIDAGVPLIGIPILGDQWYNTEKYIYFKIGIRLNLPELTEEIFKEAIVTVISDQSYRENIIKLRTLMKDEPQTPLERAVWWIEYVLRHGGAKHLRAAGANISWPQYLELELDLDKLLNESKNGVIYFSLGTNVNTSILTPKKVQMLVKVFSELPYEVIWKWDLDSMPGKSENIKIYKWLPQPDLLRHPNVKLFITQGGLQSTDEAIDAGVPLIGIPMFADQWYNTEKYPYFKIGIKLVMLTLTEEIFKEAIETVITDSSYQENIRRLRAIVKDEPQKPLERAVWWTEHVLRHGGAKHLRAAGANITWVQYLELELVAIVVLVLFSIIVVLVFVLYYLRKLMLPAFKTKIKTM
ncbi:UDP-glycosyltransferase UGT5-like [Maniola jurtina]|uniref:UDP-glycosyltransferase UGT5-like n=1 Tax=Maniola jurtina TaxID=191418 RepID=UPI001E68DE4C|nr:UDP-glycosyltransferase UGT5-like [Maniola jurtina]